MAVTYKDVDSTTNKLIKSVMEEHHAPLKEHKLNLDAQFWTGKDEAPAVKVSGRDSFGKVVIFQPHQRAKGSPDARIVLDFSKWDAANEETREAMIDELLQGIEIRMTADEKNPEVIRDDAGRPKLKRRRADLYLACHYDVYKRHQHNSQAYITANALRAHFTQLYLFDSANGKGGRADNPDVAGRIGASATA